MLSCFSIIFVITSTLWLVPSPRWLILRGRQAEVSAAWDVLGVGHAEREKVEIEIEATMVRVPSLVNSINSHRQEDASPTYSPDSKTTHSFFDVFARDVRLRTGLAVFLMGMQQLSGIDGVLYVSSPNSLPTCSFAPHH